MTSEAPRAWPDLAGRIEGRRHVLPIRVYFEDTDFSGFVYHANYLRWCERGRSDLLRLLGIRHSDLHAAAEGGIPAAFAVRRLEVDYLLPARIDELLEVVTQCEHVGGAHIELAQIVRRGGDVLCKLKAKVVLVSQTGRPTRLPSVIAELFRQAQ
jgi:acyl-CoA thioester hydrolase